MYQTFEQTRCSNAISSEVYGPIGFKFCMRHDMGLNQSYGNCDFWCVIIDISHIRTDQMFKRYLLWSVWTDWLQIIREASWCGPLPKLWKIWFLALLNRFAFRRGYAIPNFCLVRLRRHLRRKPSVQTLYPLTFVDRLASNFMWHLLVWVSTRVMEIMIFGLLL